ncbi:MAG: SH3 domain-containing protein [Bacteroidales bacterium]|nr:SH3 domain-containing protein [Bacteroidales bacterium]
MVAFVSGRSRQNIIHNNNTAIVMMPSVPIKSSPNVSGNDLFILHEGTKVEILDKVGSWKQIKIADGNKGWIMENDIDRI